MSIQKKKTDLSVIIPCYNEEDLIVSTHERMVAVLETLQLNWEIIYIDDGSIDWTLPLLKEIAEKCPSARILSFSRNFGQQAAVTAGLKYCRGQMALVTDADLQDPPELIPGMIELMKSEGANVVYGKRVSRNRESIFKKISAFVFYRLLKFLSDVSIPADTGDFRLIDRKVIDTFNKLPERNKYIRGLVSWIGFKQVPFEFHRNPRLQGETKYTLGGMFKLAFNGIFYFSRKPLQLSLGVGFFCILISLGLAAYVIISKFARELPAIQGWASTLIIIIFFGGVQLFMIGILGEYLGSIFDEVKSRPEYIIDQEINSPAGDDK
jgi:glycosyltransferase involved in cell wall biosynthesis